MFNRRILGTAMTAALALSALAVPVAANAQSESQHRNNAIVLGAAGVLLNANHQSTLGTIALAGAAYEAFQLQHAIDQRHHERGYYDSRGRWRSGSSNRTDGYYDSYGKWHSYQDANRQGGYYDNYGLWHTYNGNYSNRTDGYYDQDGRWHGYSNNSSNRDGYYDANGRWHTYNGSNDSWRGDRYNSSSNRDGYYDSNGRWHSYDSSRTNGYYDRNGRWHANKDWLDPRSRRDENCDDRYDNGRNRNDRGRDWAATRGKKKGWDKNGKRDNRDNRDRDHDGD